MSYKSEQLDKYGWTFYQTVEDGIDYFYALHDGTDSLLVENTATAIIDVAYDELYNNRADAIAIAEFKVGDRVTYKPYDTPCPAYIKSIELGLYGADKDRLVYVLSSACNVCDVAAKTTGDDIVESQFYNGNPKF